MPGAQLLSRGTPEFWAKFGALPAEIQEHARNAFRQWRDDPAHPSLHFKRVSRSQPLYSVRIGLRHRAVGLLKSDTIYWYWIGKHDEYDRILKG